METLRWDFYDAMNRIVKVTLNRVDTRHGVNEAQLTLYSYDKRGLVTKEINAAGKETLYVYDGNGNLIQKTDADGYVTEFEYDPRNLAEAINYSDGKEVQFAYNADGVLVAMMDWNGTVNFSLDILDRIVSVNDQNEKITSYTYDAVGNKTSITYPDNTVASYTYDLLGRLTNLNDAENQNTVYAYDAASELIATAYPNGWDESYTYDAAGQLLTQLAKDPTNTPSKEILHTYAYDAAGNVTHEYRSGANGQTKYDYTHTYDALNRLTQTTGLWGYATHTYQYDSLGNLVYEKNANGANKGNEYWYNNLNQQISKKVDNKDTYTYTYDNRGNLVKAVYDKKNTVTEQYTYDGTNRMVKGVNEKGEQSHYIYNGLGYLVGNEWIIEKNAYGYNGVNTAPSAQVEGVVVCDRHSNVTGNGHINPTGKGHTTGGTTGGSTPTVNNKQAVVHKDYVLDYTSPLKDVIMETESGVGGLTYRFTYGLEKNSAVIYGIPNGVGSVAQSYTYPNGTANVVKLYYHHDRLGSTDYLTDNIAGDPTSYTEYDDWGAMVMKPILQLGARELDLVSEYTGHPYDQVLGLYFAEARMYDAADRRFVSVDPVKGSIVNAATMVQYTYVLDNPVRFVDPMGLATETYLGGRVIDTKTFNGVTYSSVRDLLARYGGGLEQTPVKEGSMTTYYRGRMRDYSVRFYTKEYSIPTRRLEFSRGYTKSIGSGNMAVFGGSNYIDVEYFQKFACEVLGYHLPIWTKELEPTLEELISNLIKIAQDEVGYFEKADSYSEFIKNNPNEKEKYPDENSYYNDPDVNSGERNLTKYGKWYGSNGDYWCAQFVSWCANVAGIPESIIPKHKYTPSGVTWYTNAGTYAKRNSDYIPHEGDLVYFNNAALGRVAHVGIVVAYDPSTNRVHTIEGNSGQAVDVHDYLITDTYINGYGINGGTSYGTIPNNSTSGIGVPTT